MTDVAAASALPAFEGRPDGDHLRIARSSTARGAAAEASGFRRWLAACDERQHLEVERVPLAGLTGWHSDPTTGNILHDSGRFFTVEGLDVELPGAPVPAWRQPIINQPEVGILGILVKEFDGVLHCLMQAKVEPGNYNGVQLSPTVQATRSNYTRVHRGKAVPYLEYFQDRPRPHRLLADVRQSEQGAWFHQKRNRNVIIEVFGEVEVRDGFCWLTLAQIHALLREDDLVNMDARTVLSCLPFVGTGLAADGGDDFRSALLRSCTPEYDGRHGMGEILAWITESRTRHEVSARRVPLDEVTGWHRDEQEIRHDSGGFFRVIGVNVRAGGREVRQWMQPMIEPLGGGIVALLVRRIDGVLHALMHARIEPGYVDVIELAPTVQCTPENYAWLPASARPPFLDEVLSADERRIRYDTLLSEEGGRFFHARNRYLIIETELDPDPDTCPDHRWLAVHQLADLLRHSHYVNIQARSLVACLHSLCSGEG